MALSQQLAQTAKQTLYQTGALAAVHRLRNGRTLTATMFHRVLGRADPRWRTADPTYTVTDEFLRGCLDFFREHYNVIDLKRVTLDDGLDALPPRPMLITFDDGWADTVDCALPVLREAGVTALLFVVAGALGNRQAFWQERIFGAWRQGAIDAAAIAAAWRQVDSAAAPPGDSSEKSVRALIARIGRMSAAARAAVVTSLATSDGEPVPSMMTAEQLCQWDAAGMSVGGHGHSHEPLTALADAGPELGDSRRTLRDILGRDAGGPETMSFPHGRYDSNVVSRARGAGYRYMFTSNPVLNRPRSDGTLSDLLGRVGIDARHLGDGEGRARPESLAARLSLRPRDTIEMR